MTDAKKKCKKDHTAQSVKILTCVHPATPAMDINTAWKKPEQQEQKSLDQVYHIRLSESCSADTDRTFFPSTDIQQQFKLIETIVDIIEDQPHSYTYYIIICF